MPLTKWPTRGSRSPRILPLCTNPAPVCETTTLERRQDFSIPAAFGSSVVLPVAMSIALGMVLIKAPPIAFLLALAPTVILMARRSATAWVASAVIVAVAARGLVGLHLVPGYAQFAHLPLAWGAVCVALIRGRQRSALAHRCLTWLTILGLAVVASSILNQSQPLRGLAYLLLLGEPFALVCALLVDPPERAERRLLIWTCATLVAVQIPIAYWQAATLGSGDSVQGTLYGSGAGAHVMAGLVVVGAFWYVGSSRATFSPVSIGILAAMVGVVLIADAKQVVFALPAVVLAQRSLSTRSIAIGLIALAAVLAVVHFHTFNQGYAVPYINRALSGQTGKEAAARLIWHDATRDVGTFVFGQGPAETVSRTAYETVPAFQKTGSSLQVFGFKPARTAIKAEEVAVAAVEATGKSSHTKAFDLASFDSGMSSGVGLFGDLGALGFVAFGGLLITIFLSLRRRESAEALGAASGFAMLIILGFILDWWEQPAITLFLGTLAALALTQQGSERGRRSPGGRVRGTSSDEPAEAT